MELTQKELLTAKIACLTDLRLQKYQLIWIREHEIKVLDEIDAPEVLKLELSAKVSPDVVKQARQAVAAQRESKSAEIRETMLEITMLNRDIEALEKESKKPVGGRGGAGGAGGGTGKGGGGGN